MKVLLVTPPMMQVNAPYAAGPHLAGFLRKRGIEAVQADLSIGLALRLFSRKGVAAMAQEIRARGRARTPTVRFFARHVATYADTVEDVMAFLQGRNPGLAGRIMTRAYLPEGPRFGVMESMRQALGGADPLDTLFTPGLRHKGSQGEGERRTGCRCQVSGVRTQGVIRQVFTLLKPETRNLVSSMEERAKYLASLYVDDLVDVVREGVDGRFELSRYAEKLALSAPSFEPIARALESEPSLVDRMMDELADKMMKLHEPSMVGITVAFPGNLYAALRIARQIRKNKRPVPVVLGGGYVNTELRDLSDAGVFDYVDYISLDSGEEPLLRIVERVRKGEGPLCRTFVRREGSVVLCNDVHDGCVRHEEVGTPIHAGLPLDRYLSLVEMPNPMHRLWSDGRWNRLMLAHGCYWHRCAFCDTSLDYIARFDRASAGALVDRIEAVMAETGGQGFHFVDEAAPPALLKGVAQVLLEREMTISWWSNIRFEPGYTAAVARLLSTSGCVAVTGGLETVTPRLLKLMNKGVTLEGAVRSIRSLAEAGILVHAYLMYGFPTQTAQETVDALEVVRQLFAAGWVQSAYWHRFALTCHSPIAKDPAAFGIRIPARRQASFARNELSFVDPTRCDHAALGEGLRKATYNFMHGVGLDEDVRAWFDVRVPKARLTLRI